MNRKAISPFIISLTTALLISGCNKSNISDHQWETLQEEIQSTEQFIEDLAPTRRAAIALMASQELPELTESCPVERPRMRGATTLPNYVEIIEPDEIQSSQGPRLEVAADRIGDASRILERRPATYSEEDYNLLLASVEAPSDQYDYTIVADEVQAPELVGEAFQPGSFQGRVFVWSYEDERVICAASFTSSNSEQISASEINSTTLRENLYFQAFVTAIQQMKEVPTE